MLAFNEIAKILLNTAVQIKENEGFVPITAFFHSSNAPDVCPGINLQLATSNKAEARKFIHFVVEGSDEIDAVFLISECWIYKQKTKPEGKITDLSNAQLSDEDIKNRSEALMVSFVTRAGDGETTIIPFTASSSGALVLSEAEEIKGMMFANYFFDGLFPKNQTIN